MEPDKREGMDAKRREDVVRKFFADYGTILDEPDLENLAVKIHKGYAKLSDSERVQRAQTFVDMVESRKIDLTAMLGMINIIVPDKLGEFLQKHVPFELIEREIHQMAITSPPKNVDEPEKLLAVWKEIYSQAA